jgi:hypothetical protein
MRPEVASTRAGVDAIAAEAGVSKMTIYSNFDCAGRVLDGWHSPKPQASGEWLMPTEADAALKSERVR